MASQKSIGDTQDRMEVSGRRGINLTVRPRGNPASVLFDKRTKDLGETTKERDDHQKEMTELSKEIARLNSELKQKQEIITELEKQMNEMYVQKVSVEQDVEDMERKLLDKEKALKEEREQTQKRISHYVDLIREMERKHKEREKQLTAEQEDLRKSSMDKRKDVKHKSAISAGPDENQSAGGQQNLNQDSVVLAQRTKELDETIKKRDNLEEKNIEHCRTIKRLNAEKEQMQATLNDFEQCGNNMYAEKVNLEQDIEDMGAKLKDLEKALKTEREQTQKRIIQNDDEIKSKERKFKEREKQLIAERDELRKRYSQLAGQALKDNISDISDLSDPNRPMKLGEKFSELYDNEWTDIFQAQMDTLKRSEKESIQVLLSALQECYTFCKQLADKQMDMLRNGFLYHCQDASKPIPSGKDKPRLHSKEEKSLLEVRKMIGANNSGPVKQAFLAHMAGKSDKSGGKAAKEFTAYYETCTEICWPMALNDPPLYMDMEFKQGAKMDGNLYTPYYTPGDKVDFLVWPPLFNVQKGGLINKGVMAPIQEKRIIKK